MPSRGVSGPRNEVSILLCEGRYVPHDTKYVRTRYPVTRSTGEASSPSPAPGSGANVDAMPPRSKDQLVGDVVPESGFSGPLPDTGGASLLSPTRCPSLVRYSWCAA